VKRARRVWLGVHRWLGLGLGAVLALIGLTGSVIVFDHAIDAWLNPRLFTSRSSGPPLPVHVIVGTARAAVFTAGLTPTLLAVTGALIWWRRWRARRLTSRGA
jgi:uncharacterized iron-regulated membrane protein